MVIDVNNSALTEFGVAQVGESDEQATHVLGAIRSIIRSTDIQSKRLHKLSGLTTAQAVVIRAIREMGEVTTRKLSAQVALSQATVTTVLDRLQDKGLVERYRSEEDRRIVHTRLTEQGLEAYEDMPSLLDEKFLTRFEQLSAGEREKISSSLLQVAAMMNADANHAAPAENGQSTDRLSSV